MNLIAVIKKIFKQIHPYLYILFIQGISNIFIDQMTAYLF